MTDEGPTEISGANPTTAPVTGETLGTSGYFPVGAVYLMNGRTPMCARCKRTFGRTHIVPGSTKPTKEGARLGLIENPPGVLRHQCENDPRRGKARKQS